MRVLIGSETSRAIRRLILTGKTRHLSLRLQVKDLVVLRHRSMDGAALLLLTLLAFSTYIAFLRRRIVIL